MPIEDPGAHSEDSGESLRHKTIEVGRQMQSHVENVRGRREETEGGGSERSGKLVLLLSF